MANETARSSRSASAAAPLERTLVAAARAFVGEDGGDDPSPTVDDADLGRRLMDVADGLPPDLRRQLVWGARALRALAVARTGRRLHRLPVERARWFLAGLEASRFGQLRRLHRVVKMLCQYAWYLGDETWGACGYDGPWLGRVEVVSRPAPVLGVAVVAEETDDA